MLLNINSKLRNIRDKFKLDKRGVTAVEYAIIAVAMSSIILLVFKQGSLQNTLSGAMSKISTSMESANTTEKASEGEKPNS
ncbi:Flp family type IVb pilin [Vibrio parahaemolyticus]|uniref:Flp family type IVb pilin n=1 Tax=Vibrio parahaemolyticus TaxID=670 RepID=UPI0003F555AA|nr:Flp family type IVb pilin [Vibrio parahaemolyticus]KJR14081.1 pilin [Vibrio parahaemolyticus]MBE3909093.1 Flp family type IVb pilin [Vibrio parahaemolyticus]MBE4377628.1 Flp family type IVb pilin [Vibrio parahaemolyticus]MCG0023066.1 Flp family type IVb pilin [Vibrio parahaemolyticus]HCG7672796.1 Flp family type IVb pilin [Vibrio parahaemolyticus]